MQHEVPRFDMPVVVRAAVDAASEGSGLMRVDDVAQRLVREYGLPPRQQSTIFEALCRQCISRGVSIEFRPVADGEIA